LNLHRIAGTARMTTARICIKSPKDHDQFALEAISKWLDPSRCVNNTSSGWFMKSAQMLSNAPPEDTYLC
jgi:hypothetical protein